ncbi:DNL zinc finger-domain-containing protein [Sordaria brevicollis]|uniref:DNL zinc finger-domain-containing protein n=1 Tax=Sordaria brevicollis TaxID=83679 RepID=A0AAE0PAG1_SORBR|nr:DNL zinc finger-domain-containing protein [Sordaria brevicollis]
MASKRAATSTLPCIARLCSASAPAQSLKATVTAPRFLNHFVRSCHSSSQHQRPVPAVSLSLQQKQIRLKHTIPRPRSQQEAAQQSLPSSDQQQTQPQDQQAAEQQAKRDISQVPHYELTFTCIPCDFRSKHKVSKQGYHHGSVLIACPNCRNRHVISDHLKIFGDRKITVEDLLKEKGMMVKKGTLGEDGDVEFWEDGSVTAREPVPEPERPKVVVDNSPPGSSFKSVKPGDKTDGEESK